MFMLFGGGSRNWRLLRLGVFALVMGAGLAFHYRGTGYTLARGLYLVVVLSFLASAFWRNKSRRGSIGNQGTGPFPGQSQYGGDGVPTSYGSQYPPSFPYVESPQSPSPADNPPSVAAGADAPAVPVVLPVTPSLPVAAAPTGVAAVAPNVAPTGLAPTGLAPAEGAVPADGTVAPKVLNVAPTGHTSLSGPGQEPGWYPDPFDPMARHYWDGTVWTQRIKWDGKAWASA